MKIKLLFLLIVTFLGWNSVSAQDISLYQQFNGRYDFTFIGNTLNPWENNLTLDCYINTSASATLALNPDDVIEKAFLYWAGSGDGDFNIKLNDIDITPDRTFNLTQSSSGLIFFSAFKDITDQVLATGNGEYTLSDLDLNAVIPDYCTNRTNFAGWAIVVVYKNDNLPLNQLNVYDGLDYVSLGHTELIINLDNLNVIDNEDAKIGFVAWEGDVNLDFGESLSVNGTIISNPPLNPATNAFNGTNSITGSNELYNMDLDIYGIQNNIDIGDTTAEIKLTSDRDFVMVNAVVTKLNSQLPDATIVIGNIDKQCNSRVITVDYTVYNVNATDPLPHSTPVAVYANGQLIGQALTQTNIPIGGSENLQITLTIPDSFPLDFTLKFVVDDNGTGAGIVNEHDETNNEYATEVSLVISPETNELPPLESCNSGFGAANFNFSNYDDLVRTDPMQSVGFYESQENAESGMNPIIGTSNYHATATPKEIFVRVDNGVCFSVTSFLLMTKNCPPTVYNYVSANEDGKNDSFFIDGLRNIFLNFQLSVYNRWGVLVWTGNNDSEDWKGLTTKGIRIDGNHAPDGTYFYVLDLNDPDYAEPLTGFLYLNR